MSVFYMYYIIHTYCIIKWSLLIGNNDCNSVQQCPILPLATCVIYFKLTSVSPAGPISVEFDFYTHVRWKTNVSFRGGRETKQRTEKKKGNAADRAVMSHCARVSGRRLHECHLVIIINNRTTLPIIDYQVYCVYYVWLRATAYTFMIIGSTIVLYEATTQSNIYVYSGRPVKVSGGAPRRPCVTCAGAVDTMAYVLYTCVCVWESPPWPSPLRRRRRLLPLPILPYSPPPPPPPPPLSE